MTIGTDGRRRRSRLAAAAACGVLAAGLGATHVAGAPEQAPDERVSIFEFRRTLAIDAALQRIALFTADHPAGSFDQVDCPLVSTATLSAAGEAHALSTGTELQFAVTPWTGTTLAEVALRPSSAPAGTVAATDVVACTTDRPADETLTRPELVAVPLGGGLRFVDVARHYGVEPILPATPAGIGGWLAGSCLATTATGVCVAVWQSRNLALVLTFEGPAHVVGPDVPGALMTDVVPAALDEMAVVRGEPQECDVASIEADTGLTLAELPRCHGGWAISSTVPCPEPVDDTDPEATDDPARIDEDPLMRCPQVEVFHTTAQGWRRTGVVDSGCAENLVAFGVTGVSAQELLDPCDPASPELRFVRLAPGSSNPRVIALQVALTSLGYDVPVDQRYGPLTTAAVVDYQTRHGLIVDGIAGPQTLGSLGI